MRIGEKIRIVREARGLTQAELAQLLGVAQFTVSQYERGTRSVPSDDLERFAGALAMDPLLFLQAEPWSKIDAARTKYESVMAEVQSVFTTTRRRKEANSPVFVALPRRQLAFASARR